MNKIFGLLLLALVSFDSNAQNKVRGELRTEINGFQWYCYKGKEAFSVDGRSLFNDFKNVQSISFSAADKNDKGFFIVQNKTNGLYYTTALDPYTYNTMIRHCGGKELYNMYSVAMVFSNPQHKEYYVKSVHPRYTSSLYYPPSNKEILSNNFTIKDNYIITDGAYTGASRYDGKIITQGYYDRVTYQEEAKHFICDVYSPSKSIKIVDTLGVTLANNIKSAKYKGGIIELSCETGNGLMSYTGKWIVSPEVGYSEYKGFQISKIPFCLVKYKNASLYHLFDSNGTDVLGKDFDEIDAIGGDYIRIKTNGYIGILNLSGKDIIPISRGYTSIGFNASKRTFTFTKKGYSGVCNERGEEISLTKLPPAADDIIEKGGFVSAVELNNGSTKYWKVSKGGRYGLTDAEGKVIVPTEMEALESAGTGFLRYKLNGFWGLMNYTGKIIIDTDRGYTSIGDFKTFNKRFSYTMTGYKGECDATGRQISKIKVETPKQNTSVASSSGSSSSSSSSSNSNSGNNTTTIHVEHHRDPIPVQQWQACLACGGMGTMGCDNCGGSGTKYIGDRLHRCSLCNGQGIIPCRSCYGNKGHYITVYR